MKISNLLGSLGLLTTALVMGCNNTTIGSDGCADPNADPTTCMAACTDPNGCNNPTAPEYTTLNIVPDPVVITASGMPVPQQLSATGTRADGSTSSQLVGVSWTTAYNAIGTIDPNGLFTANGTVGGTVDVTATYISNGFPVAKTVTITVNIAQVVVTPGTDAAAASKFTATPTLDLTRAAGIV